MLSRPPDTATAGRGDGSRTLELSQTTLPTCTGSLVNNRESATRLKASLVSLEAMVSARSPFTVVPLFLNFFLVFFANGPWNEVRRPSQEAPAGKKVIHPIEAPDCDE